MELRDLEYFLAIAREGSLTGAAKVLHLSQPGITRSLKALEEELGKQLIIRGNRSISLTEEGMILRRRAQELLSLAERTRSEISSSDAVIEGEIFLCAGETRGLHYLTKAAKALLLEHPKVQFHISSGDRTDVTEELEKGMIDFGLLLSPIDETRYDHLLLPYEERWGILMRKDAPLASQEVIHPRDLIGKPLILPRGGDYAGTGSRVLGLSAEELTLQATYSLLFNASLMAIDGIGYVVGLDEILELGEDSPLCFRPLDPPVIGRMNVVWKKYQIMSHQARAFLEKIRLLTAPQEA
ncbi:MAG: LysR family transcriptional regulator [Blautia sp.]|nr:LysR family transcriptional regulator [Blautia sp.]